jgi:hypothetical protein
MEIIFLMEPNNSAALLGKAFDAANLLLSHAYCLTAKRAYKQHKSLVFFVTDGGRDGTISIANLTHRIEIRWLI